MAHIIHQPYPHDPGTIHYAAPPGSPVLPPPHIVDDDGGWQIARRLWRRKWLIVGTTVALAAAGVAFAMMLTPRYEAESRVLLGVQDPKIANVQSVLDGLVPNDENIRSEAYLIASRSMARQVAYRLALDQSPDFNPYLAPEPTWLERLSPGYLIADVKDWVSAMLPESETDTGDGVALTPEEREQARETYKWQTIENRLLAGIEVEPLNRSHVLSINAEFEDPVLAADVADTFARVYIERQKVTKQQAAEDANDWLQTRISDLQAKVAESERAAETYRRQNDLLSTRSDTVIGQQLAAFNQQLIVADQAKTEAHAQLSQAEGLAGKGAHTDDLPSVLQSPLIVDLRSKQADLERQAADLSARYTSKHPEMRNIGAQIQDVNGRIATEISRIVGGLRKRAQIADDQYERIAARLQDLKDRMGAANTEQIKLHQLEREADANRNMLESLLQRSKETYGQGDLSQPNAEVISAAGVPSSPSFPPSKLIVVVAIVAGLGGGILLALLIERLDRTFRTADELEDVTGLPTLAVLPTLKSLWSKRLDHVVRKPNSQYTNALRSLAAQLTFSHGAGSAPKVIMFTSAVPGEGKSHTSASFAQLMAADGHRVILLDVDWRKPAQHANFGQKNPAGILEILRGETTVEEVLHTDPQSNARVLFAGRSNGGQGVSVSLERLRLLVQRLAGQYDFVVLDTSPLMFTPEMLHLASLADTVVFAVRWGQTVRRAVTSQLRNLMRAGASLSGIVLTQVNLEKYDQYSSDDGGYLRHHYLTHDAS